MNNLVEIQDGRTVITSRDIAEWTGKEHKNVLRDIRSEIEQLGETGDLNFEESTYTTVQGYEKPMYLLTRDGFTLLAMGFTGKEAGKFKEAYIKAFNEMEEQLKKQCSDIAVIEANAVKKYLEERVEKFELSSKYTKENVFVKMLKNHL